MKLAAMEALYAGEKEAGLVVFGVLRPEVGKKYLFEKNADAFYFKVEIPKLLSLLSFRNAEAYVPGINDMVFGNPEQQIIPIQGKMGLGQEALKAMKEYREAKATGDAVTQSYYNDLFDPDTPDGKYMHDFRLKHLGYAYLDNPTEAIPNIPLVFYSFRVMVGLGFYFILFFAVTLVLSLRKTIGNRRWLLRLMIASIPLVYLSSVAGWIVAEVGRQPWTVYEMLPASASVSNIASGSLMTTFFIFLVLFTILLIAELMIMFRQIKLGPQPAEIEGKTDSEK